MRNPSKYSISVNDIPLLEYNNIFVANLVWMSRGMEGDVATFDLVVRDIPENWGYYIFDGLERFTDLLLKFKFDNDAVKILKNMNLIDSKKTEKFYKNFKFSGDVWSMKDGTVFFPGEPVIRITAPLVEANLLTAFILNVFCYPIRIMTKTLRVKIACGNTIFFAGSLVRLPGFEQGYYVLRSAYLLGSLIASPFFYKKITDELPTGKITGNINHAVIKSFPTERDAFRHVLDELLDKANFFYVMVDTYDMKNGLNIFIEEIKKTASFDYSKIMITIDSGDIKKQAHYVRKELDKNGLKKIRIQAMGNLDEYSIDAMVKSHTPIDCYITATALVNIIDNPKLEVVYKMAEITHSDGTVEQKAKLTKGKESYPGRKQVYRVYKKGKIFKDIIGFEDENLGDPLLHLIIKSGKLNYKFPETDLLKQYLGKQIDLLPEPLKEIKCKEKYNVELSKKLIKAIEDVKKIHLK